MYGLKESRVNEAGKRENAQFVCVLKGERERDTRKQWEKIGLFRTSEGAKKEKIGVEINRKCVL